MGNERGAVQLAVLAERLREQVDELLAILVLRLIKRHAQHVAQLAQRGGQTVRQSLDHRVVDLPERHLDAQPAQDRAVERTVVDDDLGGVVDQPLQLGEVLRHVAVGAVPHLNRVVVDRGGNQQHLGLLGVGVRAVRDGHGAEGF